MYKATIESVALFQNLEKDIIISICIALDHTVVLKKDFIFVRQSTATAAVCLCVCAATQYPHCECGCVPAQVEGELGKEMFIIETGMVEAFVGSENCRHAKGESTCAHCVVLGRQGPKSFFGELAVMGVREWQRR